MTTAADSISTSEPFQRLLQVRHITKYQYSQPINRSKHLLHLRPVDDIDQSVSDYRLTVTPAVSLIDFEDVFSNRTTRFELTNPYRELTIASMATVVLRRADPFAFTSVPIRPSFPLVWMPWEQTMLKPYLMPEELPETQLQEIYDYAMGFVQRNQSDLMETLFDINLTLFREYEYAPGSTNLRTSPYDVFVSRKGVCQDFANLFITMARLLGLPARYTCGYLFTGNTGGASRARSDATHAWVELYIPNVGWKDFDPTNGVLPWKDHVRVAYGRHFRDATPTAGTIYTSANESMTIDVEVVDLAEENAANVQDRRLLTTV